MSNISIQNEIIKFEIQIKNCLKHLQIYDDITKRTLYMSDIYSPKECYLLSSGIINYIWQSWNKFWRNYWMLVLFGGYYKRSLTILPISKYIPSFKISCKIEESLYNFILPTNYYLYKKKYNNNKVPFFSEPTWGDTKIIAQLGAYYEREYRITGAFNIAQELNQMLSSVSLITHTINHLQIIRNVIIHLSEDGMKNIKNNISSNYSLTSSLKYPTDIIFAKLISNGNIVIEAWCNDLITGLSLL